MDLGTENEAYCCNPNKCGPDKALPRKEGDVVQLTNEEMVLKFMHRHQIPLRRMEVYGGLVQEDVLTFSYSTVGNKLDDLADRGDVKKVAINKDQGIIEDIPEDESADRRGYFLITDQGRERASTLPE